MKIISGIYKIVNIKTGKFYIGSSKNIKRRWYVHKSALKNNRHHSQYLQRSWNKYGQSSFKFEIIKEIPFTTEENLLNEELKTVNELLPSYNVGSIGGGDNLTNHPNRNEIIKKITASIREQVDNMTGQERKDRWGHPGNTNPNWKGGISKKYCTDCGDEVCYGSKRCMTCSKDSKNNPFYGKHHSEESKKKSSDKMKGRLPSNTMPIILDGISYISQSDAARKLGVSVGTISNWINKKFCKNKHITPLHQI